MCHHRLCYLILIARVHLHLTINSAVRSFHSSLYELNKDTRGSARRCLWQSRLSLTIGRSFVVAILPRQHRQLRGGTGSPISISFFLFCCFNLKFGNVVWHQLQFADWIVAVTNHRTDTLSYYHHPFTLNLLL